MLKQKLFNCSSENVCEFQLIAWDNLYAGKGVASVTNFLKL